MVPFDIVRQVANVDASVLLRGLLDAAHHLLFGSRALLERPRWSTTIVATVSTSSSRSSRLSIHRRAGPALRSAIVVAAPGAAASVGPATTRAARATPGRARPFALPSVRNESSKGGHCDRLSLSSRTCGRQRGKEAKRQKGKGWPTPRCQATIAACAPDFWVLKIVKFLREGARLSSEGDQMRGKTHLVVGSVRIGL